LSCNPNHGSEALVGYKYAQCLSQQHDVTLIASPPVEAPNGAELHSVNAGPCNFNDVAASALMRFELRQLPKAWRLNRRQRFDVIHRVTPSAIQNTTFLPKLKLPFVIGPLLASDPPPPSFEPYLRRAVTPPSRRKFHPVRIAAGLSSRVLGAVARSHFHLRRATRILAGTRIAIEHVPREYRDRCELITYAGVEHEVFVPPAARPADRPLELLWVGRLVQYKGIELLIRSVALAAKKCELRLRVIGGGEELYVAFLRQLVAELGLERIVEFAKPVARNELPRSYQNADVFCFPTICDTYGIALLEAMSCGCAAVVSDVAGPHEIVAEGTGVKVPMCEPEQYIGDYADAIVTLAGNPALRCKLGAAARQHIVEHHDWQQIAARLLKIYASLWI
jgi:glycosyltransferase involved in cell wall biosynthesis